MLIARCAWHRRYYGFGKLLGVSCGRGLHIGFTDGICRKCAARVRADFRVSRAGGAVAGDRARWMPGIAVVALSVMVVVLLIARPVQDLPAPAHVAVEPHPQPPPDRVHPEPAPAASPAVVPPGPRPARAARVTAAGRSGPLAIRAEAAARSLPRPAVSRTPRDTQSP